MHMSENMPWIELVYIILYKTVVNIMLCIVYSQKP